MVRGYATCEYHPDILDHFNYNELSECQDKDDISASSPGGGRIAYQSANEIKIYGYSNSFGRAKHELSENIIN